MFEKMDVLYVTNKKVSDKYLIPSIIENTGDQVHIALGKKDTNEGIMEIKPDLVICDRATFLLTADQINLLNGKAYNVHPSFLPYNRGYHPNFWSHFDGTPSGVTIHCIDANIDSGKIIAQAQIYFSDNETLRSSYYSLRKLSVELFRQTYQTIRNIKDASGLIPNNTKLGTIKYKADFGNMMENLPNGWDTKIEYVRKLKEKLKKSHKINQVEKSGEK